MLLLIFFVKELTSNEDGYEKNVYFIPRNFLVMKTLGLKEAAALLLLAPESLRQMASAGKVPGARVGKRWVFLEEDLEEFIRSRYRLNWQAPVMEAVCSTKEVRRGGSISPPQTESALDARLKQVIGERHKSITTG